MIKPGFSETDRIFISRDRLLDTFRVYAFPAHKCECLVCKNCTDVFTDYTNGPYMTICDKELECIDGECKGFEWNEFMTIGEWEKLSTEEKREFVKKNVEGC